MRTIIVFPFLAGILLAACSRAAPPRDPAGYPLPDRRVASIVSAAWSNEPDRDRAGEAPAVLDAAGVRPGMAVADIGAGEGYYTLKLAERVGPQGRVIAEDIMADAVSALRIRVARAGLRTVTVTLGAADDARLPPASVDRILLVHMYHEITSPYALLARMRPALKPGGRIVVVDADRRTHLHGTPPKLLACELAAMGYVQTDFRPMPEAGGYLAQFAPRGAAPQPSAIMPCKAR